MDAGKLKDKKPWFVPKWAWNAMVNQACDAAKESLKVGKVACFVGDAAMDGLQKAVGGKDPGAVAKVAAAVSNGGLVFSKAGAAIADGKVTDEERSDVGSAIASAVEGLVPQEAVDARIDEVRKALLF